jgi:hypothetical protein
MSPLKILIDVVGGGALAFLLLLVIAVDKFTAPPSGDAPLGPNTLEVRNVTDTANQAPAETKKLRIAVLTDLARMSNNQMVAWDDMGSLLNLMGEGYKHDALRTGDVLANPNKLDYYDVLFFTCAPKGQELRDALVAFVSRGGILYASDWRYDAIAAAFPDVVDAKVRGDGVKGGVNAEVVDPGLREIIGPNIHLNFDLPEWKTAAFGGPRVTVMIKGNYMKMRYPRDTAGTPAVAPLLVKFPMGRSGQVIFTSFHNEKQTSDTEKKLLEYLVFSMMTAKVEAQIQEHITEGGFAPQRSNLLSTPKNNPSVTQKFMTSKVGPLRIALGFNNEGVRLKLHLHSPDGKDFSWEGTSTVVLEVANAAVGEWSCTITAVNPPYENFPFLLTVGEKK